ncbi:hypothetical protein G6N82_02615 [Altererythrobacter sp. BO-6]|nr:hypothetical protein G6N82_02615 [Altererythrobacter sp. BO-6]
MEIKTPWTTRRKLIIGFGASALAGAAIIGGRLGYSREEDFVIAMTKRALPDATIPSAALEHFARDYVSELHGNRLDSLNKLVLLSAALSAQGVDMLLGSTEKYKNFRRTTVTQFLIKSNYFATDGGKTGPLEYYGNLPCGQNPFSQFG